MTISEEGIPPSDGQWCGSAWGYTVYYSETRSINISLRLDKILQQGVGSNFEFKLSYKFLRKPEAKLRYKQIYKFIIYMVCGGCVFFVLRLYDWQFIEMDG